MRSCCPHRTKADPAGGGPRAPARLQPGKHGATCRHSATAQGLSPGVTPATQGPFAGSVLTLDTLQNGGDGVRRWVIAFHACEETAFDAATRLWLEGYTPSANVAGTGSVPDGRKEGADGQRQSGLLCARWKRGHRSGQGSRARQTGAAATAAGPTWRSGERSRRRGTPCTWRRTAVIA